MAPDNLAPRVKKRTIWHPDNLAPGQFGTGQFGTGQFGTRTIWHQTFDMIKLNLKDHFWQNFGQKFSFGVILTRVIACSLKIGETLPFLQLKPKLATIFFFRNVAFLAYF